jgi:hypothetical protein
MAPSTKRSSPFNDQEQEQFQRHAPHVPEIATLTGIYGIPRTAKMLSQLIVRVLRVSLALIIIRGILGTIRSAVGYTGFYLQLSMCLHMHYNSPNCDRQSRTPSSSGSGEVG